ncbi:MAG: hypothetical protein EBQ87_01155 [Planctomycetes bacterium]|nr:hypothetical protein [Planctomycetota bacterium]
MNASSPLDFSTLGATNVGFSFTVPNAGTVNSLNYNDYIRTKGDGGIAISAGSGTGNVTGLSSIAVNTPGSLFKSAPVVSFSPVVSVPATATSYLGITDGTITGLGGIPNVGGGGTGYTIGDVLQLRDTQVGGNGTGFNRFIVVTNVNPTTGAVTNFNQTVNPNSVLGVIVTNSGTGYRTTTATDLAASNPTVTFGLNSANNLAERARGLAYLQITPNSASPFNWSTPTNMVVTAANNQVQLVENANSSSTTLIPGGSSYDSGTTVLFNSGALNSVQINSGGTGYPVSQTFAVTISNGSSTVNGKATTNGAGVITSISLDSPGSGLGFVNGTSYSVTGSTFTTQASVFANRNGQNVLTSVGLAVGGSGTGYAVNDTVTIVSGAGTNATGTVTAVNAGAITAITLLTQGTGFTNGNPYTFNPLVSATGTSGTLTGFVAVGAEATATISPTGVITGLTRTVNGVGYTTAPTITFGSSGSGTGAVATAVLGTGVNAGTVTGFVYSQNYDASATVTYKMQNLSINNTGTAVATATLTADRVTAATVTSSGNNYVPNAKIPITFSGGGGSGATGYATSNGSGNSSMVVLP